MPPSALIDLMGDAPDVEAILATLPENAYVPKDEPEAAPAEEAPAEEVADPAAEAPAEAAEEAEEAKEPGAEAPAEKAEEAPAEEPAAEE